MSLNKSNQRYERADQTAASPSLWCTSKNTAPKRHSNYEIPRQTLNVTAIHLLIICILGLLKGPPSPKP